MSGRILARRCLSWAAAEDEMGDLEELFLATAREQGSAAAEARYVREAAAIGLSILRRRIARGGEDMVRLFLGASVSVVLIFLFLNMGGGLIWVYVQPYEWAVILSAMLGFAVAGNRLGAWRTILSDLRRADRTLRDGAHMDYLARIAGEAGEADADRLMAGGIALFRDRCREKIGMVEQTALDAYAGSAIAMILGFIHLMENLELPLMALGHLLGGTLCAPFFGLILGRAVLAPMAGRLTVLYGREAREMEAYRLSPGEDGAGAFRALA